MNNSPQAAANSEQAAALIEMFYNDFVYDCYSVEVRYNRSRVRQELIDSGPAMLGHVADLIEDKFPNLNTANSASDEVNWDLFAYIAWLIADIRRTYNLPDGPYTPDFRFGKQDMSKWRDYCRENATS